MSQHPYLVIDDGEYLDVFEHVINPDNGKTYFSLKGNSGTTGQHFKYGVAVDAKIFPRGIHTALTGKVEVVVAESGKIVSRHTLTAQRSKKDNEVVQFLGEVVIDGNTQHIGHGTGNTLRQKATGEMNLRLNIVKGPLASLSGGNVDRSIAATTVELS